MARIDDYESARRIAIQSLSKEPLQDILERSGFSFESPAGMRVPFMDRTYRVETPTYSFTDIFEKNKKIPIQEQILILHYLMAKPLVRLSGNWIAYREIPGASFYFGAFVKRAVAPLKTAFAQNPVLFFRAASAINGIPMDMGDASVEVRVFPRVPIRLILWKGDEEFPPEAGIIFDDSIGRILSPEDVAWMAGMVVYRMIALTDQ